MGNCFNNNTIEHHKPVVVRAKSSASLAKVRTSSSTSLEDRMVN